MHFQSITLSSDSFHPGNVIVAILTQALTECGLYTMPAKLSQILRPLLTGKKNSPPHTDHNPAWLCGKWTEYLNRFYELDPNKGIDFINKMLVQEKILGKSPFKSEAVGVKKLVNALCTLKKWQL